jgi:hypothetical protein
MRKYAPLVLSFVFGGLCVLGIQTSTFVQRLSAQTLSAKCPTGPTTPVDLAKKFGMMLMSADGAKPGVPDVWISLGGANNGGPVIQQLDGLDCDGCTLKVNLLTYAGGQFKCTNCSIATVHGIYLEGAALNTFRVLQFVHAIPGAPVPKTAPVNPNAPQVMTAVLTKPSRMDWVSLAK